VDSKRKGCSIKKVLAVLICTVLTVSAVSALDLSLGVGGLFEAGIGGGAKGGNMTFDIPTIGGGGFVFFDATYGEVSVGFSGGSLKVLNLNGSYSSLHFSLLGKYPFALGSKFVLFPLLGIDYQIFLSAKIDTKSIKVFDPGDYNALAFKFGIGGDYELTEKLYLRGQFLYGIRLANKAEKDTIGLFQGAKYNLGHGPTINVAVGYKF
jgi:hypothetical protein